MKNRFWPSLEALRHDLDIMYWRHGEQETWMPMTALGALFVKDTSSRSRRVTYDPYNYAWHVEGEAEQFRSRRQIREFLSGSAS